jgi:hypothetical protein
LRCRPKLHCRINVRWPRAERAALRVRVFDPLKRLVGGPSTVLARGEHDFLAIHLD